MEAIDQFIAACPSDMRPVERMFLYSLLRGLRPQRLLEIGAFKGGSAMIIARALRENGFGRAVGIDPLPQADFSALPLHDRYQLIVGYSPASIADASARVGGSFDFVMIDGLHTYSAVRDDVFGVLPFLAPEATLLFHDAFHYGVRKAIEHCAEKIPGIVDCGPVCSTPARETDPSVDPWLTYCGVHMLRYRQRLVSVEERLTSAYRQWPDMEARFGADLLDHNEWACSASPCQRCRNVRDELLALRTPLVVRVIQVEGQFAIDSRGWRSASTAEIAAAKHVPVIPNTVFRLLPEARVSKDTV